jgi:hypothetical protein
MKTKLFIYSITSRVISKTYGGSNYTFSVYEVIKNDLVFIAEGKACTRGHKGEDSEAFGQLIKARPDIKKMLIRNAKKALKANPDNYDAKSILKDVENSGGYYFYNMRNFGLNLKSV